MNLGVMAVKRYSTFPRVPELEPHNQMQFNVIIRTPFFEGVGIIQPLLGLLPKYYECCGQGGLNRMVADVKMSTIYSIIVEETSKQKS